MTETEISSKLRSGTVEKYWNMITEVGAPIVAALAKADDALREKIKNEVFEQLTQRYPGEVAVEANAIVINALKPG